MIGEPYIRKKNNKFIIERKIDGRTEYIKTLPNVKTLLNLLGVEASKYYGENLDETSLKASLEDERPEEENLEN